MLRIGLFGLGRWGTNILNTLKGMKGVEVVVFDPTQNPSHPPLVPTSPKGFAGRGRGEFDGVIVATPGSTHAKVALPFIKAGIPTYIEKPLTISLADARKLERAAKKSGAIVFAGHLHLYNPAYQVAKKAAQKAGKIRYLLFEGMNNGPFRDDMSAMWDWASHDVYLAIDLMNDVLPTQVQAWGIKTLRPQTSLYDWASIKLTFPNHVEAVSTTSWLAPEKRKKVTIVREKDSIVFDDTQPSHKVLVYKGMGPTVRGTAVERREPKISYPHYSSKQALRAELEAFISTIKTGKQPVTGLEQGIGVVRVLAAAEKSIKRDGRKIQI